MNPPIIPSIGRIVHYRLAESDPIHPRRVGEIRPALIVQVWAEPGTATPETACNLRVFLDGSNDTQGSHDLWITSARQGDGPRQWQSPPRV